MKYLSILAIMTLMLSFGCVNVGDTGNNLQQTGAASSSWEVPYASAAADTTYYLTNLSINNTANQTAVNLTLNDTSRAAYISKITASTNDSPLWVAVEKCTSLNSTLSCNGTWERIDQLYVTSTVPVNFDYSAAPLKIANANTFRVLLLTATNDSTAVSVNAAYFDLFGR